MEVLTKACLEVQWDLSHCMIACFYAALEEEKSAEGIIIPDTLGKAVQGIVIAVGSGVRADDGSLRALDVKAGDRVLFGKFGGTDVKVGGEDLLILRDLTFLVLSGEKKKKSA